MEIYGENGIWLFKIQLCFQECSPAKTLELPVYLNLIPYGKQEKKKTAQA
jgi:hypothetical protein